MKLTGRDATRYFSKPDPNKAGLLIFGADAMRVALKRQEVVLALIGTSGEEEMRLTRLQAADVRKDNSLVLDGIKAQGFFPGPRVVLVQDASDGLSGIFQAALSEWQQGDASLVVTAGQLNARSKLRKVFEGPKTAVAIGIYDDPPSREEIEAILKKTGIRDVSTEAMADLTALSRDIDPGDFNQTLEKLSLYKLGDTGPVSSADLEACAPVTIEADVDDAVHIIAEARVADVGPVLSRLSGQGVNPTTLCIGATRHFKTLHVAASYPQGPDAALARARPPVFGARKDRMARQARNWGMHRLESALDVLMETDLALRSSRPVPAFAMIERAFIRIAMMRPRQ